MKLIIFIFFVVLLEFCKIDYIIKFEINISLYLYQCSQHHILYTFFITISKLHSCQFKVSGSFA